MALYSCQSRNIIQITRGSSFSDSVTINNPDSSDFDLTGCTLVSQLREAKTGVLAASFTCASSAPATGVLTRTMSAALTGALDVTKQYVWGLRVTKPDASVLPEIQGGINLINNVVA